MTARHVALLRGINVGGHHRLPMAQLRELAQGLGWGDVATYIQSGNLVYRGPGTPAEQEESLRGAILEATGMDIAIMVLTGDQWLTLEARCPWPQVAEPKLVHVFVYPAPLTAEAAAAVQMLAADTPDQVLLEGRLLYLHTPTGFSRSALVPALERAPVRGLTGRATARNLATVRKISALVQD